MIEINRHASPDPADQICVKIIGLGGAGLNALDRLVLDGIENAELIAVNSDVQSLTSSVVTEKIQLGRAATRGLGAGGDPEVGLAATEESLDELRQILDGAGLVFLCAGLGGGTGSGGAPLLANLAKERGALVLAFATMPFTFEGKRRNRQAEDALLALQSVADAVICFENDKMGESVSPKAGIHQAFANADHTISQSVRSICDLLKRPGLIHIGFDELATALRSTNARCLFGFGEGEGDNRAHDALARALKSPLMDKGRMLSEAQNVLVNVSGGANMTLNEVQILMEELGRHIENETQILFGTSVDAKLANKMSVTLISSIRGSAVAVPTIPERAEVFETEPVVEPIYPQATEPDLLEIPVEPAPPKAMPRPVHAKTETQSAAAQQFSSTTTEPERKPREEKQETLAFEPVTRGRFEKSEPTIVDGEDLDVPTFLRRNVKVK
jgi:cell division protein FtsZ